MDTLTLRRPDDWHVHLRDGAVLRDTVAASARVFRRVIAMPNLKPPVRTTEDARAYRERILAVRAPGSTFEPLLVLYLTDLTTPEEIRRARASGFVHAVKLYPAGATTNADSGVRDIAGLAPVLEALEEVDLPLLVHGEVTDADVDVFDREAAFLDRVLGPIVERYPRLRVVFEHITTREAARFVQGARAGVGATITPQHLLLNRNALFEGGLRPHHYCLPVLKRETHREVLVEVATSGSPKFFLGSDSAPHAKGTKEAACGCAGCFTAPHALALYAEVFDAADSLHRLEGFASLHGPAFYGLSPHEDTVTLVREPEDVPESYTFGPEEVIPLRAGGRTAWRVVAEPA